MDRPSLILTTPVPGIPDTPSNAILSLLMPILSSYSPRLGKLKENAPRYWLVPLILKVMIPSEALTRETELL